MKDIEDILEKIERPKDGELCPAWWIRKNILSFVDQALAKLKEEPDPGELTKNIRASLERGAYRHTIVAWLKEVCRRYDWLVKRNAKLQAENKKLVEGQQAKKEAGS